MAALGAGSAPLPKAKLTAERPAEAISAAMSNPKMRQKAAVLAERLRAEDGVGQAVAYIHAHLER